MLHPSRMWLAAMALVLMAGCGAGGSSSPKEEGKGQTVVSNEPVTLKLFMRIAYPEDSIKKYIIEPVQKKYPNITIEIINNAKGSSIEDLIAADNVPDLIFLSTPYVTDMRKLEVVEDLDALAKKNSFPLDAFNKEALDAIRKAGGSSDKLYALPFSTNYAVTYYNKDIFDKFGIPYPKDGMTWDDYLDLSRKLTRVVDGVQYSGVNPYALKGGAPMSLNYINPATKQVDVTSEGWVTAFRTMLDFYSIPGNQYMKNYRDLFLKERTLATYITYDNTQNLEQLEREGKPMNWDMATFPVMKDKPGIGHGIDSHNIAISSTSKHKDAAFQVLMQLTSKEAQMELSKNGKLPAIQDAELQQVFGEKVNILKGKNTSAIFKLKAAPMRQINENDAFVSKEIDKAFDALTTGNTDINTLLRTAKEAAEQTIKKEQR
ncbi:ABC transporter substrate-binding protein [Paenibacillus sp. OAS669]|uniref:ABC transporter substrate-binding protein n=1 Tax=Paenibacillus sp. OAS669 TaxID=2663821 RepID=UPI0017893DD5|nr:extracellular solute-binding protein [Paenibacillus sp. OAS669]MBE1446554.1 multiple sugar transport system substrate-binding protein [Paenibacillus sp. OAS669]